MGFLTTSTGTILTYKQTSIVGTALVIACLFFGLFSCAAIAGDDWQNSFVSWDPITEADWNPDISWLKTKPDAVMIFEKMYDDEHNIYRLEMGKQIYTRTRIYTERGKLSATISFMYAPKVDKITDIRARTVFPDGRIYTLSKNDILSKSRKIKGMKGCDSISFTFPEVDTNCIVEYFISMYQVKLENRVYTYRDIPVQKEVPLLSGEYIWYPARPVGPDESYVYLGDPFWFWAGASKEVINSSTTDRDGRLIRVFAKHVPAWTREPYALPDTSTIADILRYYSRNEYPTDARDKIAVSYAKKDIFALSQMEKQKVHDFANRFRSLPSQAEQVGAVYTWLQDSIINFYYYDKPPQAFFSALGRTVSKFEDYKRVTDPLDLRYGSWESIDALFCNILRDLGIEAYPMLMVDRDERVFWPQAGFWQYTRFVVAVKDSAGAYKFYTPGEWGLAPGMLHWSFEAVDGIICSDPPVIARTTASPPSSNETVRNWSLTVRNDNPVQGKLVEYDLNHKARLYKVGLIWSATNHARQDLTDSLVELLPGAKISLDNVKTDSALGTPVVSRAAITYPGSVSAEAGMIALRPFDYAGAYENPFSSPERVAEIVFTYAWHQIDSVRMTCDQAKPMAELPADSTVTTLAGFCSVKYVSDSTGVTAIREFTVNRPRFAVDEYSEVRNLFKAKASLSGQPIRFKVE